MSEISRRKFLQGAEAGVVAVGLVAMAPAVAMGAAGAATSKNSKETSSLATKPEGNTSSTETIVVHIPNPRSGEIRYMVGTKEIVRHDRALVARLVHDVR